MATLWRAKDAAEDYIAERKYLRIRKELIASGKLKVVKEMSAQEKREADYKKSKKKRQKRDKKLKARLALLKLEIVVSESSDTTVRTPVYSEGEMNLRNDFEDIFNNDPKMEDFKE